MHEFQIAFPSLSETNVSLFCETERNKGKKKITILSVQCLSIVQPQGSEYPFPLFQQEKEPKSKDLVPSSGVASC